MPISDSDNVTSWAPTILQILEKRIVSLVENPQFSKSKLEIWNANDFCFWRPLVIVYMHQIVHRHMFEKVKESGDPTRLIIIIIIW